MDVFEATVQKKQISHFQILISQKNALRFFKVMTLLKCVTSNNNYIHSFNI